MVYRTKQNPYSPKLTTRVNSSYTGVRAAKPYTENSEFQINPERILQLLQLPILQTSTLELTLACPFHKEGSRPNLGVNRITGLWQCWVCGVKGNLPKLVADIHQTSYRESLRYIQQHCGLPTIQEVKERNLRELEAILRPAHAADFPAIDISHYRYGSVWWKHFGIYNTATINRFRLGWCHSTKRAVIPISYKGKWISVIKRASNEGQLPRYLYETGFDRGRILYPWDSVPRHSNSIILVEGPRDALRLQSYGFTTALAQLGSGITAAQLKLIVNNFDEVLVWSDNDTAGQLSTYYICEQLAELIPRVMVVPYLYGGIKDPNELTLLQARKCLKARMHWSVLL